MLYLIIKYMIINKYSIPTITQQNHNKIRFVANKSGNSSNVCCVFVGSVTFYFTVYYSHFTTKQQKID
jgi:hypothetical protein